MYLKETTTQCLHVYSESEINKSLNNNDLKYLLEQMVRIRTFEYAALQQYQRGKMGGFLHLYIGQESIAVGACSLLTKDDHTITAYRCHGHGLALGMTMDMCMAELFGKSTGSSKGKGGSIHFFAPDKNFWGGHGIVGAQTPLGLGLAYALKYKNIKGVALCFMGDGAVNQGCFYESLNLASLWNLPVIYIIENNGYSMGTSVDRSSAYIDCLAKRAEGFNIQWDTINGSNIFEVRTKLHTAIQRAREYSKPTVIEIFTYRHYGHSVSDSKQKIYRSEQEIDFYKKNCDPISLLKSYLIEQNILTNNDYDNIKNITRQEAELSVIFAEESPYPDISALTQDVYFEVDHQTIAGRTGKHFF